MRLIITTLTCLICHFAVAAPTSPPIRAEIHALLSRLQSAGCEFSRNGSWYSGLEAKDHLLRKLEYIEEKGTIQSTEQFIELAATKSSFSGKPYQVKCGREEATESRQWLSKQLILIRASGQKSNP